MTHRAPAAVLVWLAAAAAAQGAVPVTWQHPSVPAQEGARSERIAVASDGMLTLSRSLREVFPGESGTAAPSIIFSLVPDEDGGLYLGGGSPGSIARLDRKGTATSAFAAGELGLRALAVSPRGDLYAATFPEGRVYRIDTKGITAPHAAVEERYIWALLLDPLDNLYVASGEKGVIYRATSDGDTSVFFDSAESHVMCLARDAQGQILAGTDPGGLLYRIAPDGRATVLLDSDLREISAIAVGGGIVYAAAISAEAAPTPRRTDDKNDMRIEVTPTLDTEELLDDTDRPRKISIDLTDLLPAPSSPGEGSASRVYRIEPGRTAEVIWRSDTERVFALAATGTGLYLGTDGGGTEGRVHEVTAPGRSRLLATMRESQVTALLTGDNGVLYAATANTGRLYLLEEGLAPSGSYTSPVHDAGRTARFGTVSWDAEIPAGTRIEITTRSGNRPAPDETWSAWSPPASDEKGQPVSSPAARYIQWKAELSRIKGDATPALRHVTITILPENTAPRLRQLTVLPRGTAAGAEPPPGVRWVTWQTTDADGDASAHTIWIRKPGEAGLRRLAVGVAASPWAFDDRELAEGPWQIKVVADDYGANGPARGLTGEAMSDTFLVDRSAPRLEPVKAGESMPREGYLLLEVAASDAAGTVARGQYRPEGTTTWTQLPCKDGICDSPREDFVIELATDTTMQSITLRVHDATGNAAELDIPVPPPTQRGR